MRRLQRLFENGYTTSTRVKGPTTVGGRSVRQGRRPAHALFGALAVALLVILVAPGALASPQVAHPWSSYNTGKVEVVLPSASPSVVLFQDGNASVGAGLGLAEILEVAGTPSGHPVVVEAAYPAQAVGFNGSTVLAASGGPFSLAARLDVFPSDTDLWNASPPGTLAPRGIASGGTTLNVTYAPGTGASGPDGLGVTWAVSGWPWVSTNDRLALEFVFSVYSGQSITACTDAGASGGGPGCAGVPLESGSIVSSPFLVAVEGEGPTGPMASVAWSPTAASGASASVPVAAGVQATSGNVGDLLLTVSGGGAGYLAGSLDFALAAPSGALAPAVPRLTGDVGVFGAALAGFAAVAGVGVVAFRRREARLRDEL